MTAFPRSFSRACAASVAREIVADFDVRVRALLLELVPDLELPPSDLGGA